MNSMGATRRNLHCLLSRVCRKRSYGAQPQGGTSPSSSSSPQLINLEYEYSAHKLVPFPLFLSVLLLLLFHISLFFSFLGFLGFNP